MKTPVLCLILLSLSPLAAYAQPLETLSCSSLDANGDSTGAGDVATIVLDGDLGATQGSAHVILAGSGESAIHLTGTFEKGGASHATRVPEHYLSVYAHSGAATAGKKAEITLSNFDTSDNYSGELDLTDSEGNALQQLQISCSPSNPVPPLQDVEPTPSPFPPHHCGRCAF